MAHDDRSQNIGIVSKCHCRASIAMSTPWMLPCERSCSPWRNHIPSARQAVPVLRLPTWQEKAVRVRPARFNLCKMCTMSDHPHFTVAQMVTALQEAKGMSFLAAKRLGCSHETVARYCRKHPAVQAAKDAERGVMVDEGELRLWAAVRAGHPWAIAFCLRTLGRNRGYIERVEQTGADGQPMALTITIRYADPPVEDAPWPPPAS